MNTTSKEMSFKLTFATLSYHTLLLPYWVSQAGAKKSIVSLHFTFLLSKTYKKNQLLSAYHLMGLLTIFNSDVFKTNFNVTHLLFSETNIG